MNTIKYKEGGSISKENKEMLMNQAIELKHHADELMKVLEKSEYIEPWVVAKAERATTDLSDITHYLEGNSRKMKWGGYMKEGGEISEFNMEEFLKFIYPNVKGIMDSNNIDIDKDFIVSKDMKIAYVPHFMYEYEDNKVSELAIYYFDAQDKHIGHIEIDLEEQEIEVEFPSWNVDDEDKYEDGGMMANGGRLDVGRYYKTKDGKQVRYLGNTKDPEVGTFMNKADGVFKVRYDEIEGNASVFAEGGEIYVDLFVERDEMPYKVKVIVDKYEDEYGEDISYQSLLDMQKEVENVGYTFDFGLDSMPYGLRPIGVDITQLRDYDDDDYYADGGQLRKIKGNNFSTQIENGQKFKALIQKVYDDQSGEHRYPIEFIKATAMTSLPIVKNDGKNYIKGYSYKGTLTHFEFLDDSNFIKALEYIDRPSIRSIKFEDGGMMAMGGATFSDKVKSISKRLNKTKVPLKYRKEYGKYFNKKEATQSAQRIVGAITKKEK
jgi:hypothetical protein